VKRRSFITLLGGAAAAWPIAARAQQPAMPVAAFLSLAEQSAERMQAFQEGLREAGYVEGRNVAIEYRSADGHGDRLAEIVADMVRRQVAVITAISDQTALAAKAATATIPIVFVSGNNPVEFGLVTSLNRPGANLTGVTTLNVEVGAKRLQLMHQVAPTAKRIAALINPSDPTAAILSRDLDAAARTLGLELDVVQASNDRDFEAAFAALRQRRSTALVIGGDPFFNSRSEQLARLALAHVLPAIYQYRAFAAAGGLLSYGSSFIESHRLAGTYTGRVLKGEKPADLPVQQATNIELIINLKTAKVLGIDIPPTLLARADEVIE